MRKAKSQANFNKRVDKNIGTIQGLCEDLRDYSKLRETNNPSLIEEIEKQIYSLRDSMRKYIDEHIR